MRENDSVENSGGVSEAAERARGYSPPEGPGGFPLPAQGGEQFFYYAWKEVFAFHRVFF